MLNQENPDYEIAFLTDSAYMKTDIERIKDQITSVADDRNGDGEVLVTINEYIVSGNGNGQVEMAAMARVINDLSNYESVIYIMDENNLAEEQSQNPSLFAYADETDYSNIGVLWKDCPLLTSIDLTSEVQLQDGKTQTIDSQKVFEDLRVCIRSRNFDETNTETAQKYEDNWNLYQKITGISSWVEEKESSRAPPFCGVGQTIKNNDRKAVKDLAGTSPYDTSSLTAQFLKR